MPIVKLSCVVTFAASHFLTKYKGKCENLHGHNYKLIITIEDTVKENGMAVDFKDMKQIAEDKVLKIVDHHHLNDIIDNPSAENLAVWIWDKLKEELPLIKLTVFETEDYYCEYEGK